jgi:EspG family
MTPVRFDPETATLQLDRETFAALIAHAAEPTGNASPPAELQAVGVLHDGRYHPALEQGLDAVLNPVCRLQVRGADPHGREDHCDGWVAASAAGFLLPVQGELWEFVVVHPSFVPERLARIVGLGPRPRAPTARPVELGTELLDQLTASDPGRRADALQRVLSSGPEDAQAIARALASGFRSRWEVVVRWLPAPGSTGQRAMHVIDTETTLWAVEPAGIGPVVWPTTPTAVWRLLVTLLPRDEELARG